MEVRSFPRHYFKFSEKPPSIRPIDYWTDDETQKDVGDAFQFYPALCHCVRLGDVRGRIHARGGKE